MSNRVEYSLFSEFTVQINMSHTNIGWNCTGLVTSHINIGWMAMWFWYRSFAGLVSPKAWLRVDSALTPYAT